MDFIQGELMKTLFVLIISSLIVVGCKVEQEATDFNTMERSLASVDDGSKVINKCDNLDDIYSCQKQTECQALVDSSDKFISCFESPTQVDVPDIKDIIEDDISDEVEVVVVKDGSEPEASSANQETEITEVSDENQEVEEDIDFSTDYSCGKNNKKVIVCHVPQGNPENAHSICIAPQAWEAAHESLHEHNGVEDHLGACTLREIETLKSLRE